MKPINCILVILVVFALLFGCIQQEPVSKKTSPITSIQELVLTEQELSQLNLVLDGNICSYENYQTDSTSPLAQYSMCIYSVPQLKDTNIVIELQKFTNVEDLNGAYQYTSLHLRGFEGLISENDYGDLSRFYVSNESAIYYYHL